jgi:hypothetical protein
MRYDRHITFQATAGTRWPAGRFVAHAGQYTVTAGRAFCERNRRGTLIVLRVPGQETPRVVPADELPDDVDLGAYGLRVRSNRASARSNAWTATASLFQLGRFQARRLLHRGYPWARVWLQLLPGPDSPGELQRVDPPTG